MQDAAVSWYEKIPAKTQKKNWYDEVPAKPLPTKEELYQQAQKQIEPQRKTAIPDVLYEGLQELKSIYEAPGDLIGKGIDQLEENPIAGALNIGQGIAHGAFTLSGIPQLISGLSTGLKAVGLKDEAENFEKVMSLPSTIVKEGTELINEGLERVGIDQNAQYLAIKNAAQALISTGAPQYQPLTSLLTAEGQDQIAESVNGINDLMANIATFKIIGDTMPKKPTSPNIPESNLREIETKKGKRFVDTKTGKFTTKQTEKPQNTETIKTEQNVQNITQVGITEQKPQNSYKTWLENQPNVTLEQKQNLGTTGKGETAAAYTQKTGEGFKVSYADYTPDASFAKEIGRVLSNKLTVEELKTFESEYKKLGYDKGGLTDRFSSAVKRITTNPELREQAPKLTKYLEEQKVPFEKVSEKPNAPVPEFPTTQTERKKISSEFESGVGGKSHFNSLKNFTNDTELNNYLTEVGKSVEKPRGVMGEKVVNDLAATLGIREKDIMKVQKGETRNVEQFTGMRQVLVDNLNEMSKFIKENDKLSPESAQTLKDMFLTHQAMQSKVMGLASESARVLQSLNRKIDPREFDILNEGFKKLKDAGVDVTNPANMGKAIKKILDPSTGDKAVFWWYQSLLSNPLTDVANITGNASYLSSELVSRTVFEPQNTFAVMRGLKEGLKEFRKEAYEVWKAEKSDLSKWDFEASELRKVYDPSPNNIQNKLLRGTARIGHVVLPTTRLRIEDAFFRNVARNIEREAGVKKISSELKTDKNIVRDNLKILEESIKNETKDIKDLTDTEKRFFRTIEDYQKYARELTFVEPLGKTGNLFQRVTNSNAFLKWTFPFIRIATNLTKEGLKHTPYYIGKNIASGNWSNLSPRQKTTMVRRAVAGTSIMGGISYLQSQGKVEITGDGPVDKNKRELWLKAGYKPNHIYLKDKDGKLQGIPYNNINPFGILLSVQGNISDYSKYDTKFNNEDNTIDQKVSLTLAKLGNTFLDQSFMWGAQSLVKSIEEGDANLLSKIITSPLPNIGGAIRGIEGDYTQYQRLSFWDNVNYKLGFSEMGLAEDLKPKIDISGQPKDIGYRRFPYQVSEVGENKVFKYILDNNIRLGVPGRPSKKGQPISDDEYDSYKKISGQALQTRLNKIYPLLVRMKPDKAEKLIRKIAEQEREKAKNKIKFGRTK
jgi:hypothetical protein